MTPSHPEEVTLVVNELVSNAMRNGVGEINLVLRASRTEVLVAVQDTGPAFVVPPVGADPFREGGRGLPMVAALASSWGILSLGKPASWCGAPSTTEPAALVAKP